MEGLASEEKKESLMMKVLSTIVTVYRDRWKCKL